MVITDCGAIHIGRQRDNHSIISHSSSAVSYVLGCRLMLPMGVGSMVVELLDVVLCKLEVGVILILLI